mmetsp:Transcript_63912/g.101725  ORF Transcript_63912/g.101725 Transcript_63912/m.101725 type:complete len:88 (-) Transcript_63912:1096-1359(-)
MRLMSPFLICDSLGMKPPNNRNDSTKYCDKLILIELASVRKDKRVNKLFNPLMKPAGNKYFHLSRGYGSKYHSAAYKSINGMLDESM